MSVAPVYLDGPLEGQVYVVKQSEIDTGQIIIPAADRLDDLSATAMPVVYTVTRVQVFGQVVVVASTAGGMPTLETLFERLISDQARAAAE